MSDDLTSLAQESGSRYDQAISLGKEDLQLRAVKYLLLRLTAGGLNIADVDKLRALAGAAFFEADVTSQVDGIRNSKESSPLAVALAGVVAQAKGSRKTAMLGAVLGAHAALGARVDQNAHDGFAEMQGAIVGAAAFEVHRMLEQILVTPSWSDFATRD
jgi:hypothetical protein